MSGAHGTRRLLRGAAVGGAVALVAVALIAWGGWLWVERLLVSESERDVAAALSQADRLLEQARRDVDRSLDALVRLADEGGDAVVAAEALARGLELEVLSFFDSRGSVLSSKHWPEQAGLPDSALAAIDGPAAARRVEGAWGSSIALVGGRRLAGGASGESLSLAGGRRLSTLHLTETLAPDVAAAWIDARPAANDPARWPTESLGELSHWLDWLATDGPAAFTDLAVGRRPLRDPDGRLLATLVVAIEPPALDGELPPALAIASLLLVVALGAFVGGTVAARAARPVDRLVRAVDAIAAGEADYTFPSRAEHELDRLAEAFSRLQRSLERQQRRSAAAERVAGWEEVARRVAHEVKNPLVPIRLTMENLVRARRDPVAFDGLFEDGVRTILEEVDQLRRLVDEFSAFARLPAPQLRSIELNPLLDGVLELHAAEPGLEIVRAYGTPLRVEADADQLSRALKNVVGNAVEAMRENSGAARLELRTRVEDGMVEIEIADNGPGIPAAAVGRMLEPYFTTKSAGTGLGMAITYRIVIEHGGELEAENRAAGGARVRLRLPQKGEGS